MPSKCRKFQTAVSFALQKDHNWDRKIARKWVVDNYPYIKEMCDAGYFFRDVATAIEEGRKSKFDGKA